MKKALSKKNLWDWTPPIFKSTLGLGLGFIPTKWWLGKSFRNYMRFAKDAQWWPAERAREYQFKRLREILKLAYERTKYHRKAFDSVGFQPPDFKSLDDMSLLPTIDKSVVVENLVDICARDVKDRDIDYISTGGTSGIPLRFYINTNRSSIEYAYLTVSWERAGYELGMPMAVLRGKIVKSHRNGFYHEYDPILKHHCYSNFHMTDKNMQRYLQHILNIGPCMLHAYPSSAHAFARFMIKTSERSPRNVKGVLLESENVYSDQVSDIERAFKLRTFSLYGHSEKCVLAAQCEHTHNYHIWPTYGYFELLDEEGNPVTTPGQHGEIVGTGFINTVMPFIRYRTGDWATYVGSHCEACGREHPIITDIKGRWPQGELIARDRSVVSMTALNVHDDTLMHVREYQFHQSEPGKAVLWIIPDVPLDEREQQRIVKNMNRRLQNQVVLELEIRTELEKTARGKQPRVIQERTPSLQHSNT